MSEDPNTSFLHIVREPEPPLDDDWEPNDDDAPDAPPSGARAPFTRGDHVEIAERLVESLRNDAPTTFSDGKHYHYDHARGVFREVSSAELSRRVQRFAGMPIVGGKKPKPLELKASDVSGTIRLAGDQLADPDYFTDAPRVMVFKDCTVEARASGVEQRVHSPKYRARWAFPFAFPKQTEPSSFLAFFRETWRDDDDRDDKIALLQEYMGISMLGLATKYQRAIVLVGDGANGKGVLSNVIERCMPPGSVCSIPPQDIGQEYRRAMLAGKLLNVVAELPEADILDAESWKSVVAGDSTTGREIRKEPFTFKPIAGHIYSANRLPGTTDQTHGFWRRLLVVKFNRVFLEHEQDPDLADRIVAHEAPAVVAWALAGAQRVLATGRLTAPSSATDELEAWRRAADQVQAFTEECCSRLALDVSPTAGTPASRLYKAFREWATENGHKPMASNKFGERMRLLGMAAHHTKIGNLYPVRLLGGGPW